MNSNVYRDNIDTSTKTKLSPNPDRPQLGPLGHPRFLLFQCNLQAIRYVRGPCVRPKPGGASAAH